MTLDPANNLAETELTESVSDTATTLPVADASVFPDADSEGAFNVLVWDSEANINPSDAPDAEFVRVTSVDTTADELTVERGQEDTTASAKADGSTVADTFSVKDRDDIDAGIAGKADDPHGSESHSSEVVHEGEDAAFGETTHDSVSTENLPNTPTFDDGYQSDGETVSKVNNGVVYSGHSDFNGSYQSAINFAEANDYSAVLLAPQDEMEFESVTVSDNIHLFGSGPGMVNEAGTAQFSDLTISSGNVSVKRVNVFNEININGGRAVLSEVSCDGPVSVTENSCFITNCRTLDVTLDSNFNVVVGNVNVVVTDNGDGNEVGLNT